MIELVCRVAGAIIFEALALIVWNFGARSPRILWRDLRNSLASGRRLGLAVLIALLGSIFFLTAVVLLAPALVNPRAQFSPVVIGTLLVALLVDFLIGSDLRALIFTRRVS